MTREERYKHYYNEGYNAGSVKGYEQAIEKACEWLTRELCYTARATNLFNNISATKEFVSGFKKAMEGE